MAVTVHVTLNRFPEFAGRFDARVQGAFQAGVTAFVAAADGSTPVDTGALRANKTISVGVGQAEITWNQHYAAYVEFGTYKMAARSYARSSVPVAERVIAAQLAGIFG